MKKLLYLFSATLLVLTSCSKDDETADVASETLLPKKIIETTVENGSSGSYTYTLTYDGNKLKDMSVTDGSRTVYTYTGDVITKVELFYSSVLQSTDVYAYEGGKLISKITTPAFNATSQQKLTFVYNSNGTVNVNESEIINKTEIKYDTTTLYAFLNGNIASSEYINGEREKITSTYDDKKSPFYNVTGLKLLLDLDNELGFDFYSANNTLNSTTVTYDSSGKIVETATVATANKYNAAGFLSEAFSGDSKNSFKLEITY
jgi:hypothetical protein